jgi:hypothetical protein
MLSDNQPNPDIQNSLRSIPTVASNLVQLFLLESVISVMRKKHLKIGVETTPEMLHILNVPQKNGNAW